MLPNRSKPLTTIATADQTKRFFVYARKSTDDQSRQLRSIPDQLAELREMAKKESLEIVDVFTEQRTAKKPGRPVLAEMLHRVECGEAAGILARHPDRLSRNAIDAGRIFHLIDTGKITAMRFPTFRFDPSASGKFMLSIMFGQSKYYLDNLSENIRRGIRQKLSNGFWPMRAPVGYLNDRTSRTIKPDPEKSALVAKAFELYATGAYTIDQIKAALDTLGLTNRYGRPLDRSNYHRMLQTPLYCGLILYAGETHEGSHEPIISKELFDAAQAVLARKAKPKAPRLKPYIYRGMFRCGECGCFITTEKQKGVNYLRCTKRVKKDCSQRYVHEDDISRQVDEALQQFCLNDLTASALVADFEHEQRNADGAAEATFSELRERIWAIDEKLARLMEALLSELIDADEYRTQKKTLVEAKRREQDALAKLTKTKESWFEPAIRFVKAANEAVKIASFHDIAEKRDFLKKNGSNLKIKNKRIGFEPRGAWKTLVNPGRLAHHEIAARDARAAFGGKSSHDLLKRRGRDSNSRFRREPSRLAIIATVLQRSGLGFTSAAGLGCSRGLRAARQRDAWPKCWIASCDCRSFARSAARQSRFQQRRSRGRDDAQRDKLDSAHNSPLDAQAP